MFDGCKYSDLIKGILLLSVGEVTDFDFLQGVFEAILSSLHFVYTWVGTVT